MTFWQTVGAVALVVGPVTGYLVAIGRATTKALQGDTKRVEDVLVAKIDGLDRALTAEMREIRSALEGHSHPRAS